MLPDFPAVKEKLNRRLRQILKVKIARHLGPFSQVKTVSMPEGQGTTLSRNDGSLSKSHFENTEVSAESKVDPDKLDPIEINRLLDELAEKLAEKRIKQFFEVTNQAVEEVGNSLKRKPDESMVDSYFRSLERVHIDFDHSGEPVMPSLLAGSKAGQELGEALDQIANTPELAQRLKIIIDRKREEWRDRESSRNLVE
jgi:hypothetical protein